MTKRKSECDIDGCTTITYGKHCRKHAYELRRKFSSTRRMQRNHSLVKKYGITVDEFEAYWVVFRGRCGICEKEMDMPAHRQGQSLDVVAVDHCHKSNQVRGLLCNACNKGLGLFMDSPIILEKAINYLNP